MRNGIVVLWSICGRCLCIFGGVLEQIPYGCILKEHLSLQGHGGSRFVSLLLPLGSSGIASIPDGSELGERMSL